MMNKQNSEKTCTKEKRCSQDLNRTMDDNIEEETVEETDQENESGFT